MSVVPLNYRAENDFRPLTKISTIDRRDFPVSANLVTGNIVRPGHWMQVVSDGVDLPTGEVLCAYPSWVQWDFDDVVGFPDANLNGQITLLIGKHRGKTRFYARATAGVLTVPVAGNLLTVGPAAAADVTAINSAAGATVIQAGDGILSARSGATVGYLARCLAIADGFLEYETV